MTKTRPKNPTQALGVDKKGSLDSTMSPDESILAYHANENGSLVVILNNGQKFRYEAGEIPAQFRYLVPENR
jgi:hypothetical protein